MSLLSEAMESCVMQDRITASDGYGGFSSTWSDGAAFKAAIVLDNSLQARVAAVQGVTGIFTVTTEKNVNLQFHDVFKRASDGKIFRVTSEDKKTPASAGLNMRCVTAEEWRLAE